MLQQQELNMCATILGDMLTFLHHEHTKNLQKHHPSPHVISREVEILVLVLLETLICAVKDLDRTSSVMVITLFCFIYVIIACCKFSYRSRHLFPLKSLNKKDICYHRAFPNARKCYFMMLCMFLKAVTTKMF